jgi:chromosome segregation ATPase
MAQETADGDVEAVLKGASTRGELPSWTGRLSQALRPTPEATLAVRAALGAFADGFGFDSREAALRASDQITEGDDSSAAAILSLEGNAPAGRPPAPAGDGLIGNAADLARASARFRDAVEALLGRTWVVRDRAAARRLLPSLAEGCRLVTLKGDIFPTGTCCSTPRPSQEERRRLSRSFDASPPGAGGRKASLRVWRSEAEARRAGGAHNNRAEEQRLRKAAARRWRKNASRQGGRLTRRTVRTANNSS